jgi:hypothetical protein
VGKLLRYWAAVLHKGAGLIRSDKKISIKFLLVGILKP